jgi:hypothetical protein
MCFSQDIAPTDVPWVDGVDVRSSLCGGNNNSIESSSQNVKIWSEHILISHVAEISPQTIAKILELLGRLSVLIDRASAAELSIFNTYDEVVSVLEQLQNTKERAVDAYTRLSGLLLKISGFQPSAPPAMVEMLDRSIAIAEATVDAGEASVKEAKSDWNIS